MSLFPLPLDQRFAAFIGDLANRLKRLEQRCQVLDPGMYVVPYTGQIPASYTTGDPTVVITGQTTAIGPFPCLGWYTPHANDVVVLIPNGQSYIIAGTYS